MSVSLGVESPSSSLSNPPVTVSTSMQVLDVIAQNNMSGSGGEGPASQAIISPFGELLMSLIQLSMQNELNFKQMAAEASARVQEQARQNTNAQEQQFLNKLATELQQASQTGQLTQLSTPPAATVVAYTRSGQVLTTNPVAEVAATAESDLQGVMRLLTRQVKAAMQGAS